MTTANRASFRPILPRRLIQTIKAALRRRIVLPDIDGKEIDERAHFTSHQVRTSSTALVVRNPTLL